MLILTVQYNFLLGHAIHSLIHKLSLGFPHTILKFILTTQAGRWLIFCQPVVHRLLSYGNENDNGYDKHLRSQTDLYFAKLCITFLRYVISSFKLCIYYLGYVRIFELIPITILFPNDGAQCK